MNVNDSVASFEGDAHQHRQRALIRVCIVSNDGSPGLVAHSHHRSLSLVDWIILAARLQFVRAYATQFNRHSFDFPVTFDHEVNAENLVLEGLNSHLVGLSSLDVFVEEEELLSLAELPFIGPQVGNLFDFFLDSFLLALEGDESGKLLPGPLRIIISDLFIQDLDATSLGGKTSTMHQAMQQVGLHLVKFMVFNAEAKRHFGVVYKEESPLIFILSSISN